MLGIDIDRASGVVAVEPLGPLAEADFADLAALIDPYLDASEHLQGLIIHTRDFPGWDSFGALVGHMRFVRDHHEQLARVALVTDSAIGNLAEIIGRHFVAATVKHFPYDELERARSWVTDNASA